MRSLSAYLRVLTSHNEMNNTEIDSGMDVGKEITVGSPGKFGKKNKRRVFNKHSAWEIWKKIEVSVMKKLEKNIFPFFLPSLT